MIKPDCLVPGRTFPQNHRFVVSRDSLPARTLPYQIIPYHTMPYHIKPTMKYHTIPCASTYHTILYHTTTIPYHHHTIPCHMITYHEIPHNTKCPETSWQPAPSEKPAPILGSVQKQNQLFNSSESSLGMRAPDPCINMNREKLFISSYYSIAFHFSLFLHSESQKQKQINGDKYICCVWKPKESNLFCFPLNGMVKQ